MRRRVIAIQTVAIVSNFQKENRGVMVVNVRCNACMNEALESMALVIFGSSAAWLLR